MGQTGWRLSGDNKCVYLIFVLLLNCLLGLVVVGLCKICRLNKPQTPDMVLGGIMTEGVRIERAWKDDGVIASLG